MAVMPTISQVAAEVNEVDIFVNDGCFEFRRRQGGERWKGGANPIPEVENGLHVA